MENKELTYLLSLYQYDMTLTGTIDEICEELITLEDLDMVNIVEDDRYYLCCEIDITNSLLFWDYFEMIFRKRQD